MTIKISDEAMRAGWDAYSKACAEDGLFASEDACLAVFTAAAPFIIADAVREEREACAKAAETLNVANAVWSEEDGDVDAFDAGCDRMRTEIAAAIRARGET